MRELSVRTSTHDYTVSIGENVRFELDRFIQKSYSAIYVITDDVVGRLYLNDVTEALEKLDIPVYTTAVPSGEASKSMAMYDQLQTTLMESSMDRQSLLIALGGGVVGDLAGFVAATYMRGVDYIQVPTTILSHDSSVGGKVAINHALGKNMIGSFYPPVAVVYDVTMLVSLPSEEVRSGYAELVKEAYIADEDFLQELLATSLLALDKRQLIDHLYKGIAIKARIVEADEKEANIRMFLNFGHTLAHAIETEKGYGEMTHGEAVAIGMLFALEVSKRSTKEPLQEKKLLEWLRRNHYPLSISELHIDSLIEHMKRDKKATFHHLQMVLLKQIGMPEVMQVTEQQIKEVYMELKKELDAE